MSSQSLNGKMKLSWRLARLIVLVIAIGVFVTANLILSNYSFWKNIKLYLLVAEGGILIWIILSIILYPIIEYKQWKYEVTKNKVVIQHGIFFLNTSVIPVKRIQHLSVERGPINSRLGLVELCIHTASGAFRIPGLTNDIANHISDSVNEELHHCLNAEKKVGEI